MFINYIGNCIIIKYSDLKSKTLMNNPIEDLLMYFFNHVEIGTENPLFGPKIKFFGNIFKVLLK